ncbi:beta-1,4-galactosyltransferase 4 isoform X2 [Patella vulgata]|uniref:beta-1,4-galactosyltransferase 4 isoform X2 n=1 Tax=Patella vulgata TaxID=6465 RepID=UPI0024A8658A|nr:beta-1,4-galactosyltransferase 4 isoform X2 [Patella vulgata]
MLQSTSRGIQISGAFIIISMSSVMIYWNSYQTKSADITIVNLTRQTTEISIKTCLKNPPSLGHFVFHHFNGTLEDLNNKYQKYKPELGGKFKPLECQEREKLAIIIPYRDRQRHLMDFLSHMPPMLLRQRVEFTIFVIEQDPQEKFNRALMMNVGYLEALKQDNYSCFIFHDVDMYPINDNNIYKCSTSPRHLAVAVEKWKFRLPFRGYYGGVVAYPKAVIEKTNGFSNFYFGWGGEDDDLGARLAVVGLKFVRPAAVYGRYATPVHGKDKGNPVSKDRFRLLGNAKSRIWYDGLNSVVYNVSKIEKKKIYTHIHITVDRQKLEENVKLKNIELEMQHLKSSPINKQ